MGAGGASGNDGSKDTQTFGYETEINKQKQKEKAQKEAFGKYDKSNTNPNDNIQNKTKNTNNNNNGGNGGEGANILIAPTVAEVSQSNAANATTPVEEDPLYLRKKKTQAKGRSMTILTSSKGVNEDSTLGKKSLLGA